MWKTTTQLLNEGAVTQVKGRNCKKDFGESTRKTISPVTGESLETYKAYKEREDKRIQAELEKKLADEAESAAYEELAEVGTGALLTKFRNKLKEFGANGIIGLSRKFRIMDDDGSNTLSLQEFKKALRESKLSLSEDEARDLFRLFGNQIIFT